MEPQIPDPAYSTKLTSGLSAMGEDDIRGLYQECASWGRHYHSAIWRSFAIGGTISIGALTLFYSAPLSYLILSSVAGVLSIVLMNKFAASVRGQWYNYMGILNAIEVHWGIRSEETNPRGPLVFDVAPTEPGKTKRVRLTISWFIVCLWIAVLAMRLFEELGSQT